MKAMFFILLTFTLLITSCKKEEFQPQPQPQVEVVDSTPSLNSLLEPLYGNWKVDSVFVPGGVDSLGIFHENITYPKNDRIIIATDNTITTRDGTFSISYSQDASLHYGYYYAEHSLYLTFDGSLIIAGDLNNIKVIYCHKVDMFRMDIK